MDPGKAVPVTAAARIQRWCLFLGAFSYGIEQRGTKQHANCDGLSRLPLVRAPEDKPDEVELFYVAVVDTLPVTEKDLRKVTSHNPLLSRVMQFVESDWEGAESHPDIAPYLIAQIIDYQKKYQPSHPIISNIFLIYISIWS